MQNQTKPYLRLAQTDKSNRILNLGIARSLAASLVHIKPPPPIKLKKQEISRAEEMASPHVEEEEEEKEHYSYANNLAMGVVLPMAMRTAVELDVFDIIAKAGPGAKLSASDIATRIPNTRNPNAASMLDRILRLLASYRVLDCSDSPADRAERLYSISPVSKYFVRNGDGLSMAPFLLLLSQSVYLESWAKLKDSILEGGIPFNMVHGMHLFEYAASNPMFNEAYNKAMFSHTAIVMKKTLESYKGFDQFEKLVDVGGGLGMTLSVITSKYPHIKAINFDLPHVINNAPPYPRVEHLSGDMFESVPKGDAIILKWVLDTWDDDKCVRLLKNCYKAIPEDHGKVIVMNGVLPVAPETSEAARDISLLNAYVMIRDDGGKQRTEKEFVALASRSGFKGVDFVCCVCNFYVMEFYK